MKVPSVLLQKSLLESKLRRGFGCTEDTRSVEKVKCKFGREVRVTQRDCCNRGHSLGIIPSKESNPRTLWYVGCNGNGAVTVVGVVTGYHPST